MNEPARRAPAEFRAEVIAANREAFDLWKAVCTTVEEAISTPRSVTSAHAAAIDLLLVQAYKSFSSVYLLAVRGQEEDAAAILRRLLEIGAQAAFLAQPEASVEREERAKLWFEHDPDDRGYWWGTNLKDLFAKIGRVDTYDQDYSLLSQIAHASYRRMSTVPREGAIPLQSVRYFTLFLVVACRYLLGVTKGWNESFRLIGEDKLDTLVSQARMHFTKLKVERKTA